MMDPIDVIIKAKQIYECENRCNMCLCFIDAIKNLLPEITNCALYIEQHIYGFSFDIAQAKFGAKKLKNGRWWRMDNRQVRINYFNWLIEKHGK